MSRTTKHGKAGWAGQSKARRGREDQVKNAKSQSRGGKGLIRLLKDGLECKVFQR